MQGEFKSILQRLRRGPRGSGPPDTQDLHDHRLGNVLIQGRQNMRPVRSSRSMQSFARNSSTARQSLLPIAVQSGANSLTPKSSGTCLSHVRPFTCHDTSTEDDSSTFPGKRRTLDIYGSSHGKRLHVSSQAHAEESRGYGRNAKLS